VLDHAVGALAALGVDGFSALVSHGRARPAIRALTALQNWAPLAFVPLWRRASRERPLFAVTNGQFLVLRADAYDAVGGFAAVAASLAEDTMLGRRLVAAGRRVVLIDGARLLACRPYTRVRDAWHASVRNLTVAFFGSAALVVLAAAGLGLLYVGPVIQLAGALATRDAALSALALAEIGLGLVPRALGDRRAGHGLAGVLLHPLAIVALVAMLAESALRYRGLGSVEWRGRRYEVGDPA
jgi:hypothetical protein